jgi:hypothetical protein
MTPSKVILGVGTLSILLANRYSEYWRSVKEAILRYIFFTIMPSVVEPRVIVLIVAAKKVFFSKTDLFFNYFFLFFSAQIFHQVKPISSKCWTKKSKT